MHVLKRNDYTSVAETHCTGLNCWTVCEQECEVWAVMDLIFLNWLKWEWAKMHGRNWTLDIFDRVKHPITTSLLCTAHSHAEKPRQVLYFTVMTHFHELNTPLRWLSALPEHRRVRHTTTQLQTHLWLLSFLTSADAGGACSLSGFRSISWNMKVQPGLRAGDM